MKKGIQKLPMLRTSLLIIVCLLALLSPIAGGPAMAQQIWFNMTNYNMPGGVDGPQGWRKLFDDPNAPWPDFMNHVQVVAAAGIMQVPDDVLAKMFVKLKQKHISFAMESLAQSWVHEPECGHGVESYYDPPGARKVAEKIKAAGGQIDIVAMDEPLYYGRYYSGRDACHSSIENVAERAAAILREYQKVFPNVVIGDIEPFPAITSQSNWQNEYSVWMQAFSAASGQKLAFLQSISTGEAEREDRALPICSKAFAKSHIPHRRTDRLGIKAVCAAERLYAPDAEFEHIGKRQRQQANTSGLRFQRNGRYPTALAAAAASVAPTSMPTLGLMP
nr:hypothetical protein [Bradyrhizobium sp.]